jgi:transcription elongation factor Elf1
LTLVAQPRIIYHMALWIDQKYARLVSSQLLLVTEKQQTLNFRCPYCGDSRKNTTKTRGYLMPKDQKYYFYCHNCNISRSFDVFLRDQNPALANEYRLECLKEKGHQVTVTPAVDTTDFATSPKKRLGRQPLKGIKKISQLHHTHPAKKYIDSRLIPSHLQYKLYYVDNGYQWARDWCPGSFPERDVSRDPRILLPLISKDNRCFGAILRSILPEGKSIGRYIKASWDKDDCGFLYGLDTINFDKRVYVVEGQFDSLFLMNSVAVGSLHWGLIKGHFNQMPVTIVLDNEPRNSSTKVAMEKAIQSGYDVCVWPAHVKHKDINDMVMNGMSGPEIQQIIDTNTFNGLKAKLAMSIWSK